MRAERLAEAAGVAAFLFLTFAPLVALVAEVRPADLAALSGGRLPLLGRTVALAAAVAVSAGVVSLFAALHGRIAWVALLMLPMPAYIHALAWYPVAGAAPGWVAAWWVELMAWLPVALLASSAAVEAIDPSLIEAARLHQPAWPLVMRVALPLAAPGALAGAGLVFLLSAADYTLPSFFSTVTYPLEIFADFSARAEAGRAAAIALPLVALNVAVLALAQAPLRAAAMRRRPLASAGFGELPRGLRALASAAALLVIAPALAVVVALVKSAAAPAALAGAAREIVFSFGVAGAATFLALAPAFAAARLLARSPWFWYLAILPLAIPAPLAGVGLASVWNRPSIPFVYNSAAMPVLAALARFLPLAAILLAASLRRIDPALEDAARVFQKSCIGRWRMVTLPLVRPGAVAAGALVFAFTLGEIGATLLVAPPGRATLSMKIYNYLHFGATDTVAALCLVVSAAVLAAALPLVVRR